MVVNSSVDISVLETFNLVAYDGQNHDFTSRGTQTASSWLIEDELRSRSVTTAGGLGLAGSDVGESLAQHMSNLREGMNMHNRNL